MKAFWREEELTDNEAKLLQLCFEAHAKSALRQNISSVVLSEAARGSGDYTKALMAALCTLGAVHAPLVTTYQMLVIHFPELEKAFKDGYMIPGWGSSFSNEDEEIWGEVFKEIEVQHPILWNRIETITELLKEKGLKPNPSVATAAVGIILKMPPQILPWLFINGRLNTWTCLFMESTMKAS